MEAKLFQDRQVEEKEQLKRLERQKQVEEAHRMEKEVEEFKKLEDQKKKDRLAKNKDHLDLVLKQMKEQPKMFAKTGVAIIKSWTNTL